MGGLIDLTGKRFGMLIVVGRAADTYTSGGNLKINWLCECDCGRTKIIDGKSLRNGSTTSCGLHKQKDIAGQRFGKLTAIRVIGQDKYSRNIWECVCDCGNLTEVMIGNLTSGDTTSCGCNHDGNPTHGQTGTRLFNIWQKMKDRCYCPTNDAYVNYGGRGITICDEWKDDFICFKNWAEDNGYENNLTIERKDVNGNYCPENCCWISKGEQANNKRNTIRINGKTLKEICEITGFKYERLYQHYVKGDLEEWLKKQNVFL